jgi:hypothetical protein
VITLLRPEHLGLAPVDRDVPSLAQETPVLKWEWPSGMYEAPTELREVAKLKEDVRRKKKERTLYFPLSTFNNFMTMTGIICVMLLFFPLSTDQESNFSLIYLFVFMSPDIFPLSLSRSRIAVKSR